MKKKLKRILLIDDELLTLKINAKIIEKLDIVEEIIPMQEAKMALQYLQTRLPDGKYPAPEMIFLDINMPGMNGWEFLTAYQKLATDQLATHILMMLTSSPNPDDMMKTKDFNMINGYMEKPLTTDKMKSILSRHFPERIK